MSKFSFRRSDTMAFKHIAHGFIPAATIAPRPAVPRTPPPRSPYPSPERPRSALAAAILSTTLTGRTVALPPTRQRSYSESDCSYNETRSAIEPYASTAEFRREQWNESLASRPRLPSPACSDDDDEEEDVEEEVQSDPDEGHVYSSIVRESRSPGQDAVYAVPLKKKANLMSESSDMTDSSDFGLLSASESDPKPIQENIQAQTVETQKAAVPRKEQKERTPRITPSPDLADDLSVESPKNHPKKKTVSKKSIRKGSRSDLTDEAFKEVLTMHKERLEELKERNQALVTERQALMQQCDDQSGCLKESQLRVEELERHNRRLLAATERSPRRGEVAELISLRQQAQELVDENDGLKVTVHRLNVELSRYQTKFRPLSKQESSRINGLPLKGPPPPWLLDMKYLSPLFLAYEDRLNEKDVLLKACEEELKNFRVRVEEVVMENGQLHQELRRSSSVNHREWRQLQDQAKLVLEENQVLMEQLEVQQAKAKDSHNRHIHEVSKVTKQLMLLESEKQSLEEELSETRRQLHTLQAHTSLDSMVSREEYTSAVNKLRRKLQQEEEKKKAECEELLSVVASLEAEKKAWLLENANLAAQNQTMEAEIEILRKGHRKAQRKIGLLTQQVEDALDKEVAAHQYLASIINLAERTTHERDQLINMASTLEQDKQGVLNRIIEGTMRLGKLQEKVKVYKQRAAASLGVMGHRLQEQEEDFAGKTDCYQREIRHLQRLLRDRQEALDQVLQQKREVEGELEIVWQTASRENQRMKEALFDSFSRGALSADLEEAFNRKLSSHTGVRALSFPQEAFPLSPQRAEEQQREDRASPQAKRAQATSPRSTARRGRGRPPLQHSPMFESDSDQQQNLSSDESEKNGLDFYS